MGLDGFSMGNLITNAEQTVAQVAGEAKFLAAKESKIEVKKNAESAKDGGIKRKNEEENNKKQKNSEKNDNENDDEQHFFDPTLNHMSEEEIENSNLKDFSINLNEATNQIELINVKEQRIMETIDAKDLMNILSKLNHASGIFVNKKI